MLNTAGDEVVQDLGHGRPTITALLAIKSRTSDPARRKASTARASMAFPRRLRDAVEA